MVPQAGEKGYRIKRAASALRCLSMTPGRSSHGHYKRHTLYLMLSMPQKLLCAVTLWILSPIAEGRYHDDGLLADTEGLRLMRGEESHTRVITQRLD